MLRKKASLFLTGINLKGNISRALVGAFSAFFATSALSAKGSETSFKTYEQQYDLAIIGGGSGGLATAFQANKHGLKVLVIDYVEETIHKHKWGLGGTCVNVGCIPKKLMHKAAQSHEQLINAYDYGWVLPEGINERKDKQSQDITKYFQWNKMQGAVQNYIKSINFGYVSKASREGVDYLNCLATFKDTKTLICSKNPEIIKNYVSNGELPSNQDLKSFYQIKAKNFLIATGTRPSYLSCEGSNLAITSDDIFNRKKPPGKTLVVGGGYVAVEVAGFLKGMGNDVTMMTRGQYLRSFDRGMVKLILEDLKERNVKIIEKSLPVSLKKNKQNNRILVTTQNQVTKKQNQPQEFDTVLFALGRTATTDKLNAKKIGLQLSNNQKILTNKNQIQKTNIDNIYAIGDVVEGLPELTSTATKMGWHLGRRIAQRMGKKQFSKRQMFISLQNYPTTVFTPLEYSCCGMSEEQAISQFGNDIQVYHTMFTPLEESLLQKYSEDGSNYRKNAYGKAVVQKSTDKVLGLHFAGPNAGEVMQGYAVAMRLGLTKLQLDSTIGIHPTSAEELTNMDVTKSSGEQYMKTSC